jgi:hypothetical protein
MHMLVFNNYFCNRKSELYIGDRVAVLNDLLYRTRGGKSDFVGKVQKYPNAKCAIHHFNSLK